MPDACRSHTPKCLQPLGHNITTVNQTAYDLGEGEMHLRRGRQVSLRVKRGTLRSKVARGCAVSNKIESLVAEGKLTPSQAVRLHALAQLAYEGIMDDLAPATNAAPASASQGGCSDCSLPDASGGCGNDCNEDAN